MPGEFEPHSGCLMIWPRRPGSWKKDPGQAREAFTKVAKAIAKSEPVYMLAWPEDCSGAGEMLGTDQEYNIHVIPIKTNDSWARDVGPTFVVPNGQKAPAGNTGSKNRADFSGLRGIDWKFNAWGGSVDGLYADWELDDQAAEKFCQEMGIPCYNAHPFVLEGGSIHTDGEGTVIVTEACLLSKGRNPELTREEISENLCGWLGAEKVIWLPHGIYNDETNEHVDNVCAFTGPGEVVLAWTDDKNDPQYEMSRADLEVLRNETDAMGRPVRVVKLPVPSRPIRITEEDLEGFVFEEGEDVREAGERLAASYVNFYIANGAVIVPQFGDVNDAAAVKILGECFPGRGIIPIPAREILLGGGNIHCITQQIPYAERRSG